MSIMPGPLVSAISGRVTAMLAARADFPLDRLADAVLVSDAIAAHAGRTWRGEDVGLAIRTATARSTSASARCARAARRASCRELEVPGLGGSLERLVDR